MQTELIMIGILLVSPVIVFVGHTGLSRIYRSQPPQLVAVKAIILGLLPTGALLWLFVFRAVPVNAEAASMFIYCILVYFSLGLTYFHFFNMSETARRIRILYEIEKAGSLSPDGLTALYKTNDIITIRLKRLVAIKQIEYSGQYYTLRGKTLYVAALCILAWRKILNLDHRND